MIIYLILIILFVIWIIYLIIVHFKNRLHSNHKDSSLTSYKWSEVLWPFNKEPFKIYKHLSPENKGAFWSLSGTIIIAILTSWLGFTVQHMVYNNSQAEFGKLSHYQLVEKFAPVYNLFADSINPNGLFDELQYAAAKELYKKGSFDSIINPFLKNQGNWQGIIDDAKRFVEIMGPTKNFFYNQSSIDSITIYNATILIGIKMFEITTDSIMQDSARTVDTIVRHLTSKHNSEVGGLRKNDVDIAALSYSYIKAARGFKESNDKSSYETSVSSILNFFIVQPLLKARILLNNEISPHKKNNSVSYSIFILFISIFVGYMLFRILLMRVLNRKSLEPNPRLSQDDLNKLLRKLDNLEKDKQLLENAFNESKRTINDNENKLSRAQKEYEETLNKQSVLIEQLQAQIEELSNK